MSVSWLRDRLGKRPRSPLVETPLSFRSFPFPHELLSVPQEPLPVAQVPGDKWAPHPTGAAGSFPSVLHPAWRSLDSGMCGSPRSGQGKECACFGRTRRQWGSSRWLRASSFCTGSGIIPAVSPRAPAPPDRLCRPPVRSAKTQGACSPAPLSGPRLGRRARCSLLQHDQNCKLGANLFQEHRVRVSCRNRRCKCRYPFQPHTCLYFSESREENGMLDPVRGPTRGPPSTEGRRARVPDLHLVHPERSAAQRFRVGAPPRTSWVNLVEQTA